MVSRFQADNLLVLSVRAVYFRLAGIARGYKHFGAPRGQRGVALEQGFAGLTQN